MEVGKQVTITPSRVELGARCYRRHALQDVLRKAKFHSPSLEFGTVIHSGASAWWKADKDNLDDGLAARKIAKLAAKDSWHTRFTMNPRVSVESISEEMALAMIEHYTMLASFSGPFTGNWQSVTIEERLELPIAKIYKERFKRDVRTEAKLSFQCDRVLFNKDEGRLAIIDTKTAARLDKRWESQWNRSIQMRLYKLLAQEIYGLTDVDVVIEGVLKKVPSDIKYIVCPDWSDDMLEEALNLAWEIAITDEELVNTAHPEQHAVVGTSFNYGDCHAYNYECPFLSICDAEPNERLGILKGEYFEIEEELY